MGLYLLALKLSSAWLPRVGGIWVTMLDPEVSESESGVFQAAFEYAALGMLFVAPDLKIRRANRALAAMLGQSPHDLAGLQVLQLADPQDRESLHEALQSVGATPGAAATIDARFLRRGNPALWMRIDIATVPTPAGFVIHLRDMTARRRLDMEHGLTTEVFEILDRTDDAEAATRLILSATRRALGIEAAAIRLAHEGDFTYAAHEGFPADFIAAENCLRKLDEKGELASDDQGTPVLECTCGLVLLGRTDPKNPIFTPSGCVCVNDTLAVKSHDWVDQRIGARDRCVHSGYRSVALIPIRSKNDIIGLLQLNDHRPDQLPPELISFLESIARSVGIALERKRVQDRLARSYEMLTQAHAVTRSGQWTWDLRRNRVEWSESYYALVGLKPGEVEPSPEVWTSTIHPEDRQRVQEAVDNAHLDTGPIDLEWRVLFPDGTIRWLMSRCHIERDAENAPVRCTGISLDITAHKTAERERRELEREVDHLQRLESLGRLAGGVAHDVNNVLGVIMAIGSLLETHQDPGIAKDAALLIRAASRGRDLVKGLRDFSRKKLESAAETDLNELARGEAQLIERTCLKRVTVNLDLETNLPTVFGEGTSIQNALMNLCVNAMDAMPNKGTLTLRTRRIGEEFVGLIVEDDGEGMAPEVLTRAMEPFFTTKPMGKGTGLGLSQVYGTMKAHGGSVDVESTVGKGTQVRLAFPVMKQRLAARADASATSVPARSLKVLVIDDEDSLRGLVLEILKSLGHAPQEASHGLEALSKIEAGLSVDLVVLDLNMPGLDGVETLARMRALRPELPVLLATGHADERLPTVLTRFPGVHTLMKPFGRRELVDALARCLSS